MDYDKELLRDAKLNEQQVRFIRRTLLCAFDTDKRRISLTSPQMQAPHPKGMTIKELSEHQALAQSTVSGIVERLEKKRLVRRSTDPADRRRTRIEVTERVKLYIQQDEPLRRLGPLVLALQLATDDERTTVLEGLSLLQRLLMSTNKPVEGFLDQRCDCPDGFPHLRNLHRWWGDAFWRSQCPHR